MSWVVEVKERQELLRERAARLKDVEAARKVERLIAEAPVPPEGAGVGYTLWSGEKAEVSWQCLREAERVLLTAEDGDAVAATIPRLIAGVDRLSARDPRRSLLKTPLKRIYNDWADTGRLNGDAKHDVLALFDEVYAASDDQHRDIRAFRNLLLGSAMWLTAAVLTLGLIHLIDPSWVSLCRAGGSEQVCLSGAAAQGADLFQLALVGTLGGLLGAVIPLSKSRTIRSRYNVRAAQIALKPALGAAMAIIGVLLIQSDITGLTPSSDALLAYGALFGMSQQLFTTFVDLNANKLLGQVNTPKRGRRRMFGTLMARVHRPPRAAA